MKNYYYEVHIFYSKNDGYSKFFKQNKPLDDEKEIINEAIIEFPEIWYDIEMCDYAVEITEENYNRATADL